MPTNSDIASRAPASRIVFIACVLAVCAAGGLVFSGQLLLDLAEHGMSREAAYRLVQKHAMRAWKEDLNFHKLVRSDRKITSKIPRKRLEQAFNLKRQLRNVDKILARVFGK